MSISGQTDSASLLTRVDALLQHAERLSRTAASAGDFYGTILNELADILGADGAGVWSIRDGAAALFFDTRTAPSWVWSVIAAEPIGRLEVDRTVIVPPHVGGRLPNATEFARCIACLAVAPGLQLALDVRLPADAQRGENVAEIVAAVAAIVVEFHRGRQLARLFSLSAERDRVAALCQNLHSSLDRSRIALELANDGAAALRSDRVSVLLPYAGEFRLEAVTAVNELNHRANASRAIEQLVHELRSLGQSLSWTSAFGSPSEDAATQAGWSYLQESGASRVRVEPLTCSRTRESSDRSLTSSDRSLTTSATNGRSSVWIGAYGAAVFESFGPEPPNPDFDGVAELCRHAAVALQNGAAFESQGLRGHVRQWRDLVASHRMQTIIGVVIAVVILLTFIPTDFELEARGQVQPAQRRHLYAPADGLITEVAVSNAKQVEANDVLIVMRNPDLDLEEQRIRGEIATTNSRLASVRAARTDPDRRGPAATSSGQLTAEEEELKQSIASLNRQLEIINRRIADLTLRSPMAGQVVRWDLIRSLEARPVRQGQLLMQVVDTHGPWQIELRIPDRFVRHVLAAQAQAKDGLNVRFLFRMAPNTTYSAKLTTLSMATDLDQDGELSTLAIVPLHQSDIPDLRPGSSVIARIHCGRRSIGYVWLREFIEFMQTRVLF